MDASNYNNSNPQTRSISSTPPPSPVGVVETSFVEEEKTSSIPYLSKLTAFTILFLSVLYSLSSLITYLVEKLLVKPEANNYDYSYFSGVDSFLVISAISTLMIALPASALLLFLTRQSEKGESWRMSQKWRRIIYTVTLVILIISVISTLIGTVYTVFSNSLNLEVSSSYYGSGSSDDKNPNAGAKIGAAIISGLVAVVIFVLGGMTFISEYKARWRHMVWGILALFTLTGAIVGVVSVLKVQEQIKEQNKKQQDYSKENYNDDYSADSSYNDNYNNTSSAKSDLQSVKSDLIYYSGKNNGKYPTKAKWDDGSLKPIYLLSSDATLKKITYTPTGCDTNGCTAYSLSMKDEDSGETVTITNSDNSY